MSTSRETRQSVKRSTSRPGTFAELIRLLPEKLDGWARQKPDRLCDDRTIYDYMDGAAEVYLTYAFAGLVVAGYGRQRAPSIVVELFDMTRSFDAYGVFTNGRDEALPDATIGQGAELRDALLTFWRDQYFVAIRADADDVPKTVTTALRDLGLAIAAAIGRDGPLPEVLSYLPGAGRVPHSERYINGRDALNYHHDFGDRNLLHVGPDTQAVLATYRRNDARRDLLCVLFPSAAKAGQACRDFVANFAREADAEGAAKVGDGQWVAVAVEGRFLAAALDAPTRDEALELAGQAIQRYRKAQKRPSKKESSP
ncbi:MAG: hypothetical protein JXQ73_01600 [Phycisphaerae bacterium]|nr:hypothetical protein [Phycisphaerae bacterium]